MSNEEHEHWIALFIEQRETGVVTSARQFLERHPDAPRDLADSLSTLGETESLLPTTILPGRRLFGDYEILEELGRGATSRVFLARPLEGEDPAPVALKILEGTSHTRTRDRFFRECETLRGLKIPGVASVIDSGVVDGTPYLALEYVPGDSLATLVRHARSTSRVPADIPSAHETPYQRIAALGATLARAVEALHDQGVIHRDLKPANVLVDTTGSPILVDFGLASGLDASTLTGTGDLLGTIPYMAPEHARGSEAGAAADIFGVGAVLFELLTLQAPHAGEDALTVLQSVQRRRVRDVRALNPEVPSDLATVVQRATAPRIATRYATAATLAEDLEAVVVGQPIRADSPTTLERLTDLFYTRRELRWSIPLVLFGMLSAGVALQFHDPHPDPARSTEPAAAAQPPAIDRDAVLAAAERNAAIAWADFRVDPGHPRITGAIAKAFESLRELEPTEPLVELLNALQREELPDAPQEVWIELLVEGERLRREGDLDAALSTFQEAAELHPGSPMVAAFVARLARHHEDEATAEREISASLRVLPEHPALLHRLSVLLVRRGDRLYQEERDREAERVLVEATEAWEANPAAWHRLAFVRVRLRDFDGATEAARRQLSLPVTNTEIERDRALRTIAVTLDRSGHREEAREILEGILDRRPDYMPAILSYALVLDAMCLLDEARRAYESALDLNDREITALAGLVHLHSGSNRETCDVCEKLFQEKPELLDVDAAEWYAVEFLELTRGDHPGTNHVMTSLRRVCQSTEIRDTLDALIEEEVDDTRLGRLVRARRLFDE